MLTASGGGVGGWWSVVGTHLTKEAVGMRPLLVDGSFDYAQDDGEGRRRSQWACLGLVLIMRLRRISIRRYRATLLQGSTHVGLE